MHAPASPQPLHLPRLAAAQPDTWVALPEGGPAVVQRVLHLTHRLADQRAAEGGEWLLCLSGEVVIDLPGGQWLRLRAGETVSLPGAVVWQALPVSSDALLLRTSQAL